MKKRIVTVAVVAVVIFLLALPKLGWFKAKQEQLPGATGPGKLQVNALVVKPRLLDNKLNVTGSVLPNESLELRSEVSGKIVRITFSEGKPVRKGDLLVQTEDDEIEAQLEKQRYNRKLNEDNEFRQRKLLEKDAISQEEYDNALNRLNTTVADVRLLEAQLNKTRIRAPFDGIVGLRFVSEGAYISPATVIATLYNISPAKIEFAVPGRYSTQVAIGKKIRFTIESDSRVFDGEVYAIEPRIDPDTRTLKIRALADNKSGRLLPGQFVKVELILESISNALLVPTEAVIPEQAGKKVFVVRNGKAQETPIETGIRTDVALEVLSGLHPGDTVLTTGILQLRNGIDVQVSKLD
ncbi:MAG: efflux RND transporter periplasmic adaptor subunit [Cytophagales bacterium]|nr:efflux RND transporter periplasmic adaptor subunit [Cytophagales bacterium]